MARAGPQTWARAASDAGGLPSAQQRGTKTHAAPHCTETRCQGAGRAAGAQAGALAGGRRWPWTGAGTEQAGFAHCGMRCPNMRGTAAAGRHTPCRHRRPTPRRAGRLLPLCCGEGVACRGSGCTLRHPAGTLPSTAGPVRERAFLDGRRWADSAAAWTGPATHALCVLPSSYGL